MTPAEAADLPEKGAVVVASDTVPPFKPHLVVDVWVNESKTMARLQLRGVKVWSDASRWTLAPAGTKAAPVTRRR